MRRQTTQLIPRGHIRRRAAGHGAGIQTVQNSAADVSEAQSMRMSHEPRALRNHPPNGRDRLIAACGRHAIGGLEHNLFQIGIAPAPFGDFQAGAQLPVGVIK